jgi:hypothetical protein
METMETKPSGPMALMTDKVEEADVGLNGEVRLDASFRLCAVI